MAAAMGYSINIPVIVRALAGQLFRAGDLNPPIEINREFLLALDAGDDEEDLATVTTDYHNQWWTAPTEECVPLLNWWTLDDCLAHHRKVTGIKGILPPSLLKTTYTWSRHLADAGPEGKEMLCEKCRLYRGVALGVLSNLSDIRHHVNGLAVLREARVDTARRQTAGLFQLYEAALLKELQSGGPSLDKGKGKAQQDTSRRADAVRQQAAAEFVRLQKRPQLKWTWGESLTKQDVLKVFKLSQHDGTLHSGYVQSLPGGHSAADSSLADLAESIALFSKVGDDVPTIPELPAHQYPTHFSQPPLRTYYDASAAMPPAGTSPADSPTSYVGPPPVPSRTHSRDKNISRVFSLCSGLLLI